MQREGSERTHEERSIYRAYYVDGAYGGGEPVTIFPRDPRTGMQVWSGETGYPGDGNYVDFHKKAVAGRASVLAGDGAAGGYGG